ncbi:trypsin-like peptidase domain-containing protein [Aquisphaera insulae]|uniref:trypsin-like peptidase domain-containing protein n=1 Tax=Aquisphaera insulae TaxID=2712864 RepID=UPI0013EA2521|nr:trypsin-like peptidase domain-containing protein [Aquisphaera insulae]
MASFNTLEHGLDDDAPPPRPSTPPVRRGFLLILLILTLSALIVYGVPFVAERTGYAWEAGRSRAATEAIAKLDKAGLVQASTLFRMAVTAVSPAVVNVQSQRARREAAGLPGLPVGGNPNVPLYQDTELGSGVIIDKEKGYIVTNHHVVKEADRILVRLGPGADVRARLVGADPKTDLAVLQVHAALKVDASWGDSDQLDIGDWVLAIGSPLGFDHSVTAGIVSATERNNVRLADYESFIQTDAAINPGNSGGPLINLEGKIVGINTAIITRTGAYEGIGLAIPTSLARRVVEGLIKSGKVVRGYLGLILDPNSENVAGDPHLPDSRGVMVAGVHPGGPADSGGLRRGDVIVKLSGRKTEDSATLRLLTAGLDVGSKVPLVYYRDGHSRTIDVTIAELPDVPEAAFLGFHVIDIPARGPNPTAIEIDSVRDGSPAAAAGLGKGMRVIGVGNFPLHNVAEMERVLRSLGPEAVLPLVVSAPDGRSILIPVNPRRNRPGDHEPPGPADRGRKEP